MKSNNLLKILPCIVNLEYCGQKLFKNKNVQHFSFILISNEIQ